MQQCPNCSGELVFDIATQKLKCGFCGSLFDPAVWTGAGAAEEQQMTADSLASAQFDGADQAVDYAQPSVQGGGFSEAFAQPGGGAAGQPGAAGAFAGAAGQPGAAGAFAGAFAQPGAQPQAGLFAQPGTGVEQQPQQNTIASAFEQREEEPYFDVIQYTCPQCGGSIYSTEDSVNGFCNYCGAQHMLNSRMSRMHQPKYVMPFKIGKDQCKGAYEEYVKKAFFLPKDMRDPGHLEQFRGIYMPYWLYDMGFNGQVVLTAEHSHRRGDYIFTEHYNCMCYVDSFFGGISYDASANFDDYFSKGIAPFNVKELVPFQPSYLSGFYADMQDVEYGIYVEPARDFTRDQIYKEIENRKYFTGATLNPSSKKTIAPQLSTRNGKGTELAFFPVWFLAYRNRDRVAYAVVNGQNGNIVSDLPVDNKKFLLFSLLTALPIYGVLLLLPTMTPKVLMCISLMIALVCTLLLNSTVNQVRIRDSRGEDLGFLSKNNKLAYAEALSRIKNKGGSGGTRKTSKAGILVAAYFILSFGMGFMQIAIAFVNSAVLAPIIAMIIVIAVIYGMNKAKGTSGGVKLITSYIITAAVSIAGALVVLANPSEDLIYYGGVVLLLAAIVLGQLFALNEYNLLTTRPLPQLNRRGGDVNA
ncbi:MAG: hypothetical protein K5686_06540 [Lachnospiraceae bacterium]|nr:hypothetical protein [Lachnospiraceae bacterium]